jgi:hypothetical protein
MDTHPQEHFQDIAMPSPSSEKCLDEASSEEQFVAQPHISEVESQIKARHRRLPRSVSEQGGPCSTRAEKDADANVRVSPYQEIPCVYEHFPVAFHVSTSRTQILRAAHPQKPRQTKIPPASQSRFSHILCEQNLVHIDLRVSAVDAPCDLPTKREIHGDQAYLGAHSQARRYHGRTYIQ